MDWPPHSFDINSIEHLCSALKFQLQLYAEPPKTIHELWERVQNESLPIPASTCRNLLSRMPSLFWRQKVATRTPNVRPFQKKL